MYKKIKQPYWLNIPTSEIELSNAKEILTRLKIDSGYCLKKVSCSNGIYVIKENKITDFFFEGPCYDYVIKAIKFTYPEITIK